MAFEKLRKWFKSGRIANFFKERKEAKLQEELDKTKLEHRKSRESERLMLRQLEGYLSSIAKSQRRLSEQYGLSMGDLGVLEKNVAITYLGGKRTVYIFPQAKEILGRLSPKDEDKLLFSLEAFKRARPEIFDARMLSRQYRGKRVELADRWRELKGKKPLFKERKPAK